MAEAAEAAEVKVEAPKATKPWPRLGVLGKWVLEEYLLWVGEFAGPMVIRAELPHVRGFLGRHPVGATEAEAEAWVMEAKDGASGGCSGYRGHRRRAMKRWRRWVVESGGGRGLGFWRWDGRAEDGVGSGGENKTGNDMKAKASMKSGGVKAGGDESRKYLAERRALVAELLKLRDQRERSLWEKGEEPVAKALELALVWLAEASEMAGGARLGMTEEEQKKLRETLENFVTNMFVRKVVEALSELHDEAKRVKKVLQLQLQHARGRELAELRQRISAGMDACRGGWGAGCGDLLRLEDKLIFHRAWFGAVVKVGAGLMLEAESRMGWAAVDEKDALERLEAVILTKLQAGRGVEGRWKKMEVEMSKEMEMAEGHSEEVNRG